jgi:LmbE family N-acetylglucosaminyl deacetylase
MHLKLLCVTAHPDDEAGNFGGTLLKYAQRGVETHVICLTPGQAATHRGNAKSDDELAAMRRKEFAASCKLLKVTHCEVLAYPDAALDKVDFYSAAADVMQRIRALRPQVVMTLGPEGGITAHPDHSMASLIATPAFHWAGRSDRLPEQLRDGVRPYRAQKLYYATANFVIPGRQPASLAPITATIDVGEFVETKIAAFKQHTSQAPLFALFESVVRPRGTSEQFHLAAAISPRQAKHETDLFAGVAADQD